jgi:hypothetical protein
MFHSIPQFHNKNLGDLQEENLAWRGNSVQTPMTVAWGHFWVLCLEVPKILVDQQHFVLKLPKVFVVELGDTVEHFPAPLVHGMPNDRNNVHLPLNIDDGSRSSQRSQDMPQGNLERRLDTENVPQYPLFCLGYFQHYHQ